MCKENKIKLVKSVLILILMDIALQHYYMVEDQVKSQEVLILILMDIALQQVFFFNPA